MISAFARLGTQRVRLTGDEPLLRCKVAGLARRLSAITGIDDLPLTGNATHMTRIATQLHAACISRDSCTAPWNTCTRSEQRLTAAGSRAGAWASVADSWHGNCSYLIVLKSISRRQS